MRRSPTPPSLGVPEAPCVPALPPRDMRCLRRTNKPKKLRDLREASTLGRAYERPLDYRVAQTRRGSNPPRLGLPGLRSSRPGGLVGYAPMQREIPEGNGRSAPARSAPEAGSDAAEHFKNAVLWSPV